MILGIYCIKDEKTTFLTPTVDQNDVSAMRNFEHAATQMQSLMYTHAADFNLYKLGSFDTDSGKIIPTDTPEFIMAGGSIDR